MILAILLSIPLWLLRIAIFLPLAVIGLPLVAALAWGGLYRVQFSGRFGRDVLRFPWLFSAWDNIEDGVDGLRGGSPDQQWWAAKTAGMSTARRIWTWSALRNPVDSLRWVPVLNPRIDPTRVRFVGMDHEPKKGEGGFYFAWLAGTAYSCIRWEFRLWPPIVRLVAIFVKSWRDGPVHMRVWLGTKLKPEDRGGLKPGDPRAIRCDVASQFKRVSQ